MLGEPKECVELVGDDVECSTVVVVAVTTDFALVVDDAFEVVPLVAKVPLDGFDITTRLPMEPVTEPGLLIA